MDVISDDLMKEIAFRSADYSALKTELRNTMMESDLDPSASYALWNQALHRIDARLGRRVRIEFEQWGIRFPCDSDTVLGELDAWERTWPDLANSLRSHPSTTPWGDNLALDYRAALRNDVFGQKLDKRLASPLSKWDEECFGRYATADLSSKAEFFTTLSVGAERLRLCRFWKHASASLSPDQKRLVWRLGSDVWNRMHHPMTEADLKTMRDEYQDEQSFQNACSALECYSPRTPRLPSPDIMLSYL
ncbi:hypothetical protein CPJ18_11060 [Agrobacterium rosae]|uniref:Uncharacterized protein n=2 Tax=Agrobacterium rosae TaxID=1972867 RepID=A0AAE5RX90_9HYPH|nr:hypothetical protein DXM21_04250 [Agrobacterium rosae]KAA3522724.1 hypothetical protein DXM25_04255 [Agrobacterium rosae]MQB47387.1 hypothetical protein [Agrobacterium rosae]POO51108.1 hypothetical protein CPJ18_11060 [Agrobacterium rosae]